MLHPSGIGLRGGGVSQLGKATGGVRDLALQPVPPTACITLDTSHHITSHHLLSPPSLLLFLCLRGGAARTAAGGVRDTTNTELAACQRAGWERE